MLVSQRSQDETEPEHAETIDEVNHDGHKKSEHTCLELKVHLFPETIRTINIETLNCPSDGKTAYLPSDHHNLNKPNGLNPLVKWAQKG